MEDKSAPAGSIPGEVVAKTTGAAPIQEYQTGRGCLMLLLILLAMTAIIVVVLLLVGDPTGAPPA